ncbi:MAG: hypothetical protein GXP25_01120 [Planctomycetes bacterium]|nr:hypothetical protein [Planctomycetota bacterium]
MIHYSCDMCGKGLLVDEEVRYIVKIEVYAAYDPMELTEEDLEEDHLNDIEKIYQQTENMSEEELQDDVYKCFRFDLCMTCQKQYLHDPLFRNVFRRSPNISPN